MGPYNFGECKKDRDESVGYINCRRERNSGEMIRNLVSWVSCPPKVICSQEVYGVVQL